MPYAIWPMPHAICHVPYAICPIPCALCHMPYAICCMPYAMCHMPYASAVQCSVAQCNAMRRSAFDCI
eukprot:10987894-Lingulodinium_polyedra.AAC.1